MRRAGTLGVRFLRAFKRHRKPVSPEPQTGRNLMFKKPLTWKALRARGMCGT
jgi:hypothetical protein